MAPESERELLIRITNKINDFILTERQFGRAYFDLEDINEGKELLRLQGRADFAISIIYCNGFIEEIEIIM